jgi:5-dehydro-2-deoxygluconokinase
VGSVIGKHDPYCRGVVLLGLEAPEQELDNAFRATSGQSLVKGFAVGRTIFNGAAEQWLAGKITDLQAVDDMASRFSSLVALWRKAHERRAA